jgi:chromosome segregation ATPase
VEELLGEREIALGAALEESTSHAEEAAMRRGEAEFAQRENTRLKGQLSEFEERQEQWRATEEERRNLRRQTWELAERLAWSEAEVQARTASMEEFKARIDANVLVEEDRDEGRRMQWRLAERLVEGREEELKRQAEIAELKKALAEKGGVEAVLRDALLERGDAREQAWSMAERVALLQDEMRLALMEKAHLEHLLAVAEEGVDTIADIENARENAKLASRRLVRRIAEMRHSLHAKPGVKSRLEDVMAAQEAVDSVIRQTQLELEAAQEEVRRLGEDLADYEAETETSDAEIAKIEERLHNQEDLERRLATAQGERDTVAEVLARINAQYGDAREDLERSQESCARAQERLRKRLEMEEQLQASESARAVAQQELARMQEEIGGIQQETLEMEAEWEKLDETARRKEALELQVAEVEQDCAALRQESAILEEEMAAAREAMQDAVAEQKRLQHLVDEKKREEERLREVDAERHQLQEELEEQSQSLERMRTEIGAQKSRQDSLNDILKAKAAVEKRIDDMQARRDEHRVAAEALKIDLGAAQNEANNLTQDIAQLESFLTSKEDVESTLRNAVTEEEAAQAELQQLSRRMEAAVGEVQTGKATLAYAWQEALDAFRHVQETVHDVASTAGIRGRGLEKELSNAKATQDALQQRLDEERRQNQSRQASLEQERGIALKKIEDAGRRNQELGNSLEAIQRQMRAGEETLERARTQFSVRNAEMGRHVTRLEAALREHLRARGGYTADTKAAIPKPPIPVHPMEERLSDLFELNEEPEEKP